MDFKNRKYILFDMDGTILKSEVGITNSIKYSMEKIGKPDLCNDEAVLRTFIGPPLTWSYMNQFNMTRQESEKAVEYFRQYYEINGAINESEIYDGIVELFIKLHENNKKIVLATSKSIEAVLDIIDYYNIKDYFDFLGTASFEDDRHEKDEVISYILDNCDGINTDNSVMIGDRIYDIEGSRAYGIDCIAVAYGYATMDELVHAKPAAIAMTVKELEELLL